MKAIGQRRGIIASYKINGRFVPKNDKFQVPDVINGVRSHPHGQIHELSISASINRLLIGCPGINCVRHAFCEVSHFLNSQFRAARLD
jgi:hypothetical protein